MLRDSIKSGAEAGTAVVATMQAGALVDDDVVNMMVERRLTDPDAAKGFILDGYPRTLEQAEHFAATESRDITDIATRAILNRAIWLCPGIPHR